MKNIIIAIAVIIIAASCEKTITVDVPVPAPKLVVNGIVNATNIFTIQVSKSAAVLAVASPNNYKVNNAVVQLFENGILKDSFLYKPATDNYVVKNGTVPMAGKKYLLTAFANGFEKVTAETTTPFNNSIQSITKRVNVRTDANGNTQDEIKIKFIDNIAENNFYLIKIKKPTYYSAAVVTYTGVYCIKSNDADIDKRSNTDPTDNNACINQEFLMTDKNFNGATKEIILYINSFDMATYTNPFDQKKYKPIVEINNITADHYKYRRSIESYRDNEDNPFSEPVLVFSNVKNGYGIFSSFTLARDTIR